MTRARILIVEDNDKNRKLVRDVLQFKGYETLEAVTGEEAIEIARHAIPDLILMDIHLPGIDGITTVERLRADPATSGIPVIAVTASAMAEDRARIDAGGFDGYQSKPIEVREFIELVEATLARVDGDEQP